MGERHALAYSRFASTFFIWGNLPNMDLRSQKEASPDYIFLSSRILFVVTVQQSEFVTKAVDSLGAIECIATVSNGTLEWRLPLTKRGFV